MRIYLTTLLIFFIGISSVNSQDDVQELGIENTDIIASQSLVDALQNRIPGARKLPIDMVIKILCSEVDNLLRQQGMKSSGILTVFDIQILPS